MSRLASLAGAVVSFSALAGSAMTQHAVIHHGQAYVRILFARSRQPFFARGRLHGLGRMARQRRLG